MKKADYFTVVQHGLLTLLLLSLSFFIDDLKAQGTSGISVQGIARDAEKAAIGDQQMEFTFEIQLATGSDPYYKEEVTIKTDPYGVFSHIIGTGTQIGSGNFNEIPFSQKLMKLVIIVSYGGKDIKLSDAPFQYTPYAKSAENGVPTGTIVAYAGAAASIPAGWTLCDGKDLDGVPGSLNLRTLLGTNRAPDLSGMFLRGTGISVVNNQPGPALGQTQLDGIKTHTGTGTATTSENGIHSHDWIYGIDRDDSGEGSSAGEFTLDLTPTTKNPIKENGNHTHTVTVTTTHTGLAETRPVNYGVNYIIKL